MTLILSGTDGLSDIDGSAATPAVRGTDANTGIFFGADTVGISTGGTSALSIDASQNITTTNKFAKASMPAGAVLQVVRATYNTTTSTTSTSFVTSNLSASITPISSTNKVLVFLLSTVATANGSTSIPVTLYRDATNVAGGTTPITDLVTSGNNWAMNFNYLDSPATTSATTYTFYFRSGNGSLVYTNITGYTSSLILMEIAA